MNSLPPLFTSESFNSNAFTNGDVLSLRIGDSRYLKLTGGTITGSLAINSTLIVNDSVTINKNTGDLATLTTTDSNGRSTLKLNCSGIDCEIGLRASLASTAPSHYYRYGSGGYRFVQSMLTGNSINYGQLTVNTSGSHLNLVNGGNTGFFEVNASGVLRIVDGLSMNLESSGLRIDSLGNTAVARSRLDLGASISDKTLGIFNNGTSFYGMSANNNLLQFSSNVGFQWYSNCTDASPINTALMNLSSNGVLTLTENAIMPKGWFVPQSTFSSAGRSGTGTVLHHVQTNYSEFFSYTYPSGPMRAIYMCNFAYFNGAGGTLNLNNGINASLYPLSVGGSSSGNIGTYGFLNQAGTTGSTSVNPVPISIYASNRVAATEFNAYSDIRLKKDIEELDDETALLFVKNISPKSFKWKNDNTNTPQIGYIAQDILRLKNNKLDYLVGTAEDKGLEKVVDEDGLINPADTRFIVSYQQSAVVLHAVVKNLLARIENLENKPKRVRKKKD